MDRFHATFISESNVETESTFILEGSSSPKRLERKAKSSAHAKKNKGRAMDTTMRKLGFKRADSRRRGRAKYSNEDGYGVRRRGLPKLSRRKRQAAYSKKSNREWEEKKVEGAEDKNFHANYRDRPTG